MKSLRFAIVKAPKVVLAAGIFSITTIIFLLWLVMRGGGGSGNGSGRAGLAENGRVKPLPEFEADQVVLCGNALLSITTGRVLTKRWLQGFDDAAPPIVRVLPAEKLVICGNRGFAQSFGFDGQAKGELTFDGKRIGAAGYSFGNSQVVFVRDSNLWLGKVDWIQSAVIDAKRVTSTNYFREDTFRAYFFWHGDSLFIPILGRTHRVDLLSGSVNQDSANVAQINRGLSPDGSKTAVAFVRGNVVVMDFASGEAKQFSTGGNFKEFLWLDEDSLAYVSNRHEISVLDAKMGKTTAFAASVTLLKIVDASPRGESVMVATAKGPMILSMENGDFVPINLPMDDGVWLDEKAILCSTSSTDTSFRGIWCVDADGSKELISNQPIDRSSAATGARAMLAIPGGAVWVSGGNLWRYESEGKIVSQLTQDQRLNPSLQILR